MKPHEKRLEFIRMRAEGSSYSQIAKALRISKSTCTAWNKELEAEIADLKREHLEELHSTYHMTKAARIKELGESLQSINKALEVADLKEIPPERLLHYKLKYMEALKSEYTGEVEPFEFSEEVHPEEIIHALGDLLNRLRAGDVTLEQASRESLIIGNLLKAYDAVEIQEKLSALETILGRRL